MERSIVQISLRYGIAAEWFWNHQNIFLSLFTTKPWKQFNLPIDAFETPKVIYKVENY